MPPIVLRRAVVAAALLAAVDATVVRAAPFPIIVWVSRSGADTTPCGALAAPCRTLQKAHDSVDVGGQIGILDAGEYGPILITKSVSIVNDGMGDAMLFGNPTNVVLIQAGAGDIVSLRGLTIDGEGTGAAGIMIKQANAVHIQNCVIRNFEGQFAWGLVDAASGVNKLFVSDTLIYNNGSTPGTGGLLIQPTGSGSVRAALDRVHLENNVVGLWVDGRQVTGNGSRVHIRDSVVSGNASDGIIAISSAGQAPAFILAERTASVHNAGIGIHADGPHAVVLLNDNTITQNGTGLGATNGGQLISYGNNKNNNNIGAEGSPTGFFSPI